MMEWKRLFLKITKQYRDQEDFVSFLSYHTENLNSCPFGTRKTLKIRLMPKA